MSLARCASERAALEGITIWLPLLTAILELGWPTLEEHATIGSVPEGQHTIARFDVRMCEAEYKIEFLFVFKLKQ